MSSEATRKQKTVRVENAEGLYMECINLDENALGDVSPRQDEGEMTRHVPTAVLEGRESEPSTAREPTESAQCGEGARRSKVRKETIRKKLGWYFVGHEVLPVILTLSHVGEKALTGISDEEMAWLKKAYSLKDGIPTALVEAWGGDLLVSIFRGIRKQIEDMLNEMRDGPELVKYEEAVFQKIEPNEVRDMLRAAESLPQAERVTFIVGEVARLEEQGDQTLTRMRQELFDDLAEQVPLYEVIDSVFSIKRWNEALRSGKGTTILSAFKDRLGESLLQDLSFVFNRTSGDKELLSRVENTVSKIAKDSRAAFDEIATLLINEEIPDDASLPPEEVVVMIIGYEEVCRRLLTVAQGADRFAASLKERIGKEGIPAYREYARAMGESLHPLFPERMTFENYAQAKLTVLNNTFDNCWENRVPGMSKILYEDLAQMMNEALTSMEAAWTAQREGVDEAMMSQQIGLSPENREKHQKGKLTVGDVFRSQPQIFLEKR